MNLQQASRQLTIHHPFLTFDQASYILLDAYNRLKHAKPYGNLLQTCLKIEWSILLRSSEQQLLARLNSFQKNSQIS